jgi:hypothetical protein
MTYSSVGSDGSYQLLDERDKRDHRDSRLGLGIKEVRRRLQQDETVFNIARPEELMERPLTAQPWGGQAAKQLNLRRWVAT